MESHPPISAFLLAGGSSSRMGTDKALLTLDRVPLLLRAARLVEPLVSSVTVLGPPRPAPLDPLTYLPDDTPALGPLGGILTALRHSRTDWNLILACDLPYLTQDFLRLLLSHTSDSADVVLPESLSGPEPVCALYHRRCAPHLAAAVARGALKITRALQGLRIHTLAPAVIKPFDSSGLLFKNMNAPADLAAARAFFESNPNRVTR